MLQSAFYTNYAMNAPKELSSASRRYDTRLSIPFIGGREAAHQALTDARELLRAVGRS